MNVRFYFGNNKKAIATCLKLGSDVQGYYFASDADPRDPTFILREELREGISFVSCLVHHSVVLEWRLMSKWRLRNGLLFCNIPGVVIIRESHQTIVKAPTWEALCAAFEQLEYPGFVYTMRGSQYLLTRALEKQQKAAKIIEQLEFKLKKASLLQLDNERQITYLNKLKVSLIGQCLEVKNALYSERTLGLWGRLSRYLGTVLKVSSRGVS